MLCYHPQLGYLHTNIKFIPQEYGTKGKPKQCRKSNIYSSLFTQAKKSTWQTCCHIAIKITISYHFLSEIPLILLSVPLLNIVLAFCEFTTLNWGSGFWSNCNSYFKFRYLIVPESCYASVMCQLILSWISFFDNFPGKSLCNSVDVKIWQFFIWQVLLSENRRTSFWNCLKYF